MDERDFEGTLVLEQMASINKLDEFFEAIDSDDTQEAVRLMSAGRCADYRNSRKKNARSRWRTLIPLIIIVDR